MCLGLYLRKACCLFSLQAGLVFSVVVLATIFIGMLIMTTYTFTILSGWTAENVSGLILAYGHAFFVIVGIKLAFYGAFREKYRPVQRGAIFMGIASLIYVVTSILSYIPSAHNYACVYHRCPDHIWMEDSYWRVYYFKNLHYILMEDTLITDNEEIEYHTSNYERNEKYPYYISSALKSRVAHETSRKNLGMMNQYIGERSKITNSTEHQSKALNLSKGTSKIYSHSISLMNDNEPLNKIKVRFPVLGVVLSVIFNLLYGAFIIYTTIIFCAYSNQLRDGFPHGFTKEDWEALQS